ncbi:class I SAM-dependent methyltransferase [Arthrobacter sp.]|uniref:class I SAM-dependent methyltransferase n=1 Tax=Arthrobacter sp. TaxID=1667 RepID=UPI002811F0F8|nr:class I SAM-dependent methyltransferase [Arthrobacter sp.]
MKDAADPHHNHPGHSEQHELSADDAGGGGHTAGNAEVWDALYSSRPKVWSGWPNAQLITEVSGLAPGSALDLGCGEGADAIWLAQHGWSVTGVDVSAVALERAAAHAADAGCRIEWIRQDLVDWISEQEYDLVSAQFLHSDVMAWQDALRPAASAVRPGGTLLIVGHHPDGLPPGGRHHSPDKFFTAEQAAYELGIGSPGWKVETMDSRERHAQGPDGQQTKVADAVLRATKLDRG